MLDLTGRLLELIGHCYQCAFDGRTDWHTLLSAAAEYFNAQAMSLKVHFNPTEESAYTGETFYVAFGQYFHLSAEEYRTSRGVNPIVKEAALLPRGQLLVKLNMSNSPEVTRTKFFRERIRGKWDHLIAVVHQTEDDVTFHSLGRGPVIDPFDKPTIEQFSLFARHFHRAAVLGMHHRSEPNGHAADPLDLLGNPIILLDADARIFRANAPAQKLLRARDGITEHEGRLQLASSIPLKPALRAALGDATKSFSVYREQARDSIGAVISTAPAAWSEGQTGMLAVVLSSPGNPPLPSSGVLREQFNLTEAEARFARQFVLSKSLSGAAASLSISAETARRHIKAVFEKTGTHSQIELTQLLLLHPHSVVSAFAR